MHEAFEKKRRALPQIVSNSYCGLYISFDVLEGRLLRFVQTSRAVQQKRKAPMLQFRKSVELIQEPLDGVRATLLRGHGPNSTICIDIGDVNKFSHSSFISIDAFQWFIHISKIRWFRQFKILCVHTAKYLSYVGISTNISPPEPKWLQPQLPRCNTSGGHRLTRQVQGMGKAPCFTCHSRIASDKTC